MRICFWMTSVFSLGGTKRVVTIIANELVKKHDVTIMTHETRLKENRLLYHLDQRIKIDYLNFYDYADNLQFNLSSIKNKGRTIINNHTGFYNTSGRCKKLAEAILPEKSRIALAEYINSKNYDVVISTAKAALWLAMLSPYLHCKTVGWQHNCYDAYLHTKKTLFWHEEALLQEFLPKLNAYLVLTPYDQRDYKKFLGIDTRVMVNPRSFVSKEKTNPEYRHFLMATRFEHAKGLDLMLDAFEEYQKLDSEWDLTIVGDGSLFMDIMVDAERRGLTSRIHLLGRTSNVSKYYLSSSILLLPSRWEGWPMVVMEAYEFGLPVITFKTAALDLIVRDGETGMLVDAFDTKQFARAMFKLSQDTELRKRLSANAIIESDKYAIEKISQDWETMLNSL